MLVVVQMARRSDINILPLVQYALDGSTDGDAQGWFTVL